jgi:hypothetical protein
MVSVALLVSIVLLAVAYGSSASDSAESKMGGDKGWVYNMLSNTFTYAVVVIPAALIIKHYQKNPAQLQGTTSEHSSRVRDSLLVVRLVSDLQLFGPFAALLIILRRHIPIF